VITEATYFSRSKMLNWVGKEPLMWLLRLVYGCLKKKYLEQR
jgi:hypothetical protein